MAKISFLRQQDITRICEKISNVTLRVKKKQGELDVMHARLESVKMSWIGAKKWKIEWEELLKEKNVLKEELMEAVEQQTRLMVGFCSWVVIV